MATKITVPKTVTIGGKTYNTIPAKQPKKEKPVISPVLFGS